MLPDRTFGVEIEAHLPTNKTRGDLAVALRNAGIRARAENYNHDVSTTTWKLTTDNSLGHDRSRSVEVVSPVLMGAHGLEQTVTVVRVMKEFGCTVSVNCGVHVHVAAGDMSMKQLHALCVNFVHCETAFDALVPASRRGSSNVYVRSNRLGFGGDCENAQINAAIDAYQQATTIRELVDVAARANRDQDYPEQTRYRKLNLRSLAKYGTVEFRQHGGSVEAEKVANWIELVVNFVERCKTSRPRKRPSMKAHDPRAEVAMLLKFAGVRPEVATFFKARCAMLAQLDARTREARRAGAELVARTMEAMQL